jgi:hypothetical protein
MYTSPRIGVVFRPFDGPLEENWVILLGNKWNVIRLLFNSRRCRNVSNLKCKRNLTRGNKVHSYGIVYLLLFLILHKKAADNAFAVWFEALKESLPGHPLFRARFCRISECLQEHAGVLPLLGYDRLLSRCSFSHFIINLSSYSWTLRSLATDSVVE